MRKITLFLHISLDSFVAVPSGKLDWIKVDEEIFDYTSEITNKADTAIYGRVTYKMMEDYWPTAGDKPNASRHDVDHSRWYKNAKKYVLSNTAKEPTLSGAQLINGNIAEKIKKIKEAPGKNIVIFGSPGAAHSLMQENLIDEYWLFQNPILLGSGTPVFKNIKAHQKLKFQQAKVFKSGVVAVNYTIA